LLRRMESCRLATLILELVPTHTRFWGVRGIMVAGREETRIDLAAALETRSDIR
jgi:hypothetical protein